MEEEDNDEINIDFSKIINFFKGKKSKKEEVKKAEEAAKEVKQDVKQKITESKSPEERKELIGEMDKISDVEKELKAEESTAQKVDESQKEVDKEVQEAKQEIKEVKEEVADIESTTEEDEDEEISIDFTKIKNFFKNLTSKGKIYKEKTHEENPSDEEELSVDWKGIADFAVKYKVILLLLIPIFLSLFLRLQPAYLPITDNWAQNNVYNFYRDQVRTQINQQYPNLPANNKEALVEREFQKFLSTEKASLDQQIKSASAYFKTRLQTDEGQTYLLAIDPYFWARHARNVVENGHPGDELRDGKPYDNHMFAPLGRQVPGDMFHAYLTAHVYKFFRAFNRGIDLLKVAFFMPVILATLAVIPAFFIARRIGGNFGGTIAAIVVAIHPAFLTRTAGGFADTDAYNILFPLVITWLFLEAFETKDMKRKAIFGSVAGFLVGLYATAWGGWWYILYFLFASSAAYLAYYSFVHRDKIKNGLENFVKEPGIKNTSILFGVFMLSSMIFTTLFAGFSHFTNFLIKAPIGFIKLKEVGISTVWPNVFTTVAEQNTSSLAGVVGQIGFGNAFLFFLAISGLIFATLKRKDFRSISAGVFLTLYLIIVYLAKSGKISLGAFVFFAALPIAIKLILAARDKENVLDPKYSILLTLWMLSTIYASVKGVRFSLLLVPAFSISFGIMAGALYDKPTRWISEELNVHKMLARISAVLLICLLLIGPMKSAWATATNEIPSMNDAWWSSLEKIRLESEPDAIINSWWDFGHWFKYIADRPVTFDGTSQNSPQAHWIGSSLLTGDEDTSIGILRMLDCGANSAFEELNEVIEDTPKSIDILYEIIVLSKNGAGNVLEGEGLSDEEINSVLENTHCEPPEDYYITSEDMVGKAGVWSHFGSWDFDKALMYNTLKKKEYKKDMDKGVTFLQERFDMTEEEAIDIYDQVQSIESSDEANHWIAPWPNYMGTTGCNNIENKTLNCGFLQGTVAAIDLKTMEVNVSTPQGVMHPEVIAYSTKNSILKKEFENNTMANIGMTLVPSEDRYFLVVSHPKLVASMFTRLFYMEGHGLTHFEKFSDQRGINGGRIIIWKVDWEGQTENLLDKYKPKEAKEETNSTLA